MSYAEQEKDEGPGTFYSDHQVNQTVITPHSLFVPKKARYQKPDGTVFEVEEKLEIITADLTSGFAETELQAWAFGTADYLAKILKFEKKYEVDLTQEYNEEARKLNYVYALSKSGGKAVRAAKETKVITENYGVQENRNGPNKSMFNFPEWMKKGEKGIKY